MSRCAAAEQRLTAPRRRVLELLLQAGQPVKAYDLISTVRRRWSAGQAADRLSRPRLPGEAGLRPPDREPQRLCRLSQGGRRPCRRLPDLRLLRRHPRDRAQGQHRDHRRRRRGRLRPDRRDHRGPRSLRGLPGTVDRNLPRPSVFSQRNGDRHGSSNPIPTVARRTTPSRWATSRRWAARRPSRRPVRSRASARARTVRTPRKSATRSRIPASASGTENSPFDRLRVRRPPRMSISPSCDGEALENPVRLERSFHSFETPP
jgi:hypothetical protein